MVTSPAYHKMSQAALIEIIQTQQTIIQRYQRVIPIENKKFAPGEKLTWLVAKNLIDQEKPNERGLVRLPIDEAAEGIGMSGGSAGRYVQAMCDRFDAAYELVPYTTKKGQRCKLVYVNPADALWSQYPDELELPLEKERPINGNGKYCPSCRTNNLHITPRRLTYQEVHTCDCCGYKKITGIINDDDNPPLPPMEYWPPKIGEQDQEEKASQAGELFEDEQDQEKGLTSEDLTCTHEGRETPVEKASQPEDLLAALPPAELRALPIWCPRRGKVPFQTQGRALQEAKPNDSTTWATFDQALAMYERSHREGWKNPFDGIGFMCDGSFVGIDLDHCRNKETGEIEPWAQAIIDRFPPTYGYVTPSEEGVRLLILAEKPGERCKNGPIEIYQERRFFAWTPMQLPGTPATIEAGQEALTALYHETFPPKEVRREPPLVFTPACPRADDEVIRKAQGAANGPKFIALWEGKTDGYKSQSEADMALCGMLAYYSGCDEGAIDRLMRQWKLFRPEKWDRPARAGETYGEGTIRRAIEGLAA